MSNEQMNEENAAAMRSVVEREQLLAEERLKASVEEAQRSMQERCQMEYANEKRKVEDLTLSLESLKKVRFNLTFRNTCTSLE